MSFCNSVLYSYRIVAVELEDLLARGQAVAGVVGRVAAEGHVRPLVDVECFVGVEPRRYVLDPRQPRRNSPLNSMVEE
jgi:hypothetical protein